MHTEREKKQIKWLLIILTVYFSSILVFSIKTDLNMYSQILFIASVGMCAVFLFVHRIPIQFGPYLHFFLLFIIVCSISLLWARNSGLATEKVVTLIQLYIMSLVLINFMLEIDNMEAVLKAIMFSGFISAVYVFAFYGVSGYMDMLSEGERAGQEINNVNAIGMYMSVTAIICFYFAYIRKQYMLYPAIVVPVVLALGTGSRKVLVMLVVGFSLIALVDYASNVDIRKSIGFLAIAIVLIAAFIWISQQEIFNTVFERFDGMLQQGRKQEHSAMIRGMMREAGIDYFKNHPFSGIGIGNTGYITQRATGRITYLHSNFVELLASVGIFGFLFYYAMYAYLLVNLFYYAFKRKVKTSLLFFVLIATKIITDYGAVSYYDKMNYIYLTAAAAEVYLNRIKEGKMKRVKSNKKSHF